MFIVYAKGGYGSEKINEQLENIFRYIKENATRIVYEYTDVTDDTIDSSYYAFDPNISKYDQLVGKHGTPFISQQDILVIGDLNILGNTYEQVAKELRFLADNDIKFLVPDLEKTYTDILRHNPTVPQKNAGIIATLSHLANSHTNKSKKIGRPKVQPPQNWEEVYNRLYDEKVITLDEALQELGIKRTKFFEFKKEYEEKLSEGNNY